MGQNGHCLGKVGAGTPAENCMHYYHRGNENNSNKSAEDVLGSANTWNSDGVRSTNGSMSTTKTKSENLGIGYNRIWAKADKVDNKFSIIKDHVTLRRRFGKYKTPTKEESEKTVPIG